MATIVRKLNTQQRYADVAKGKINGYGCGHLAGLLKLEEGERGVSFTVPGVEKGKDGFKKYDFKVSMTEEEWTALKKQLDGMLYGQEEGDKEDDG